MIHAPIRWPWQAAYGDRIELDLASIVWRLSAGVIVAGFLVSGLNFICPSKSRVFPAVVSSISVALVIACICIFIVAFMSMGYAATEGLILGLFSVAVAVGLAFDVWAARTPMHSAPHHASIASLPVTPAAFTGSTQAAPARRPRARGTSRPTPNTAAGRNAAGRLWFGFGLVAGFALVWVASSIASLFRGPIAGVWELGTPRYAHDQTFINVAASLAVMASGWLIGQALFRRRMGHWFAVGLMVSSTVFGYFFGFDGWGSLLGSTPAAIRMVYRSLSRGR